ncbi:MAG: hypothetical protein K8L99_19640 [Anaerolineae bacterium]|nr:hypothetical protein [Anaerolineae bacterium]
MIRRLLARILTAIVILMFLCLVTLTLAGIFVPDDNSSVGDIDSPQEMVTAEFDDALTVLGSSGVGQIAVFTILLPIILLAGFSDTIGHAAVLFANRVRPNRFAITILVNTVLFIIGYLIWVIMVALVSFLVFRRETAFVRAMYAVAAAYVPFIYGFLIALPYIGVLISIILNLITAILLVQLLQVFFPYNLGEAVLCAGISFVAVIIFRLTIGRPVYWVGGKLLSAVAGTTIKGRVEDALDYVVSKGS